MTPEKLKYKLVNLLINIFTSGKYSSETKFGHADYQIRYVLLNFIVISGGLILAGYTNYNIKKDQNAVAVVCACMGLICFATLLLARTKIPQIFASTMVMIFYLVFCLWITWVSSTGANVMFVYVYPLLSIMLLGMRLGVSLSLILMGLTGAVIFVPGLANFEYRASVSFRILSAFFLVFSVMIVIEITRRAKDKLIEAQKEHLSELRDEAEAANRAKSNFLASMSHEIRTPMNAIIGMTELLLRKNLSEDVRNDIQDVKQAGTNLVSIINDILDFSKIEAGKLEIIPARYMLSTLVNDTVNIIRTRLMEKPIRFYTNIDGNIPNCLFGDEVRMRQIILNLLSNAVKYTSKGFVGMSITAEKQNTDQIWLKIVISDTGLGIKPEDQERLFGNFVQLDTKRNRSIEGTGLGLAITKRLCLAMGGDIGVISEYGKGSTFTATIPQNIDSVIPFAAVDKPEEKKILVYEGRVIYAESVCWSLKNLGVPHTMVTNTEDFTAALFREEWYFVFSGYGLHEKIRQIMDESDADKIAGGKKPPLALMVEWENDASIPNVRFVSLPIQSLSIANVLNGKPDNHSFLENSPAGAICVTFPGARLLVVDDIATNLKVSKGLLAPYQAAVDTCLSGTEAIELVKRRDYDIVFMDHMMPEMDGIEATEIIREWEKEKGNSKLPIIALTANAISGMREMFIEKGFNDFLAKPIDISKMEEMLNRWIPKEKRKKGSAKAEPETPVKNPEMNKETKKKLIILADDDPAVLRQGKTIFKSKYTVATAPSAAKMFSLLENNLPCLILLDTDMPGMDGYEALKILKSKAASRDIPVILISGSAGAETEKNGRSLGALDIVCKPFDPSILLEYVYKLNL